MKQVYGSRYGTEVKRPIRLAIVDDYAVVIAGVASFLADERIDVVETGASLPVISDVDVVLYDTFAQVHGEGIDLEDYVRDSGAKVVVYSWNLRQDLIERAMVEGASGYLSKVLTGPVIVEALERIMNGETVILTGDHETSVGGAGDWPGRSSGLSPREAEVVALIARGLSNQEIAERVFMSINTIKSYIRSAYRKMGVERRTQAVIWAMAHDFAPDTERTIDSALRQYIARATLFVYQSHQYVAPINSDNHSARRNPLRKTLLADIPTLINDQGHRFKTPKKEKALWRTAKPKYSTRLR